MEKFLTRLKAHELLMYLRDLRPVGVDLNLSEGYVIHRKSRLAFDTLQIEARVKGEENDVGDVRWLIHDVVDLRWVDFDIEVYAQQLPDGRFRVQSVVRHPASTKARVVDHWSHIDAFTKADFTARQIAERGEDPSRCILAGTADPTTYFAELHVRLTNYVAHGFPTQRQRARQALGKLNHA